MFVCICRAVSDKRIRQLANQGVMTLRELSRETGLGTCCGKCVPQARDLLDQVQPADVVHGSPRPVIESTFADVA